MKKTLSMLIILATLIFDINFIATTNAKNNYNAYFVVSAYYSPLPNQKYYLKGNYEKEIRLNGRGIRGASGKKVFPGMIAAPKKYSFGTKIDLDGLGVGSVEDRGGAIVPAGVRGYNYDRIDIWMGYGDEGLKRALTWGKRTIKGKVLSKTSKTSINIQRQPALDSSVRRLDKQENIFTKGIGVKSSSQDITKLQKFLKNVGIYKSEINGVYDRSLINTIYNFQIKHKLISSGTQYGAGYWGRTTRKLVMNMYNKGELTKKSDSKINNQLFRYNIGDESSESRIKELQNIFLTIGLYDGEINGKYNDIKDFIIKYQLDNKLITHKGNRGAGYFGPKTRKIAEKDYKEALNNIKIEKEQKIEIDKIKKDITKKVDSYLAKIGTPKKGEIGVHVRILQKTLKTLGHFNVKDSAIFGSVTEQSILSYQLDRGVIDNKNHSGAGIYGPATKAQIKKDLVLKLVEKRIKEKNLITMK